MLTASGNARVHRTSPIIAQQQITQNPATLGVVMRRTQPSSAGDVGVKLPVAPVREITNPLFQPQLMYGSDA